MNFVGFPNVEQCHSASLLKQQMLRETPLRLYTDVIETFKRFEGQNAIPRVVCGVRTQEYLQFMCRPGHEQADVEDIAQVAAQFRKANFYVELHNNEIECKTYTASLLICWDPKVLFNYSVQGFLCEPSIQSIYSNVMCYVNAERNLPAIAKEQKQEILLFGCYTREWVSLPIVSKAMYKDAQEVGRALHKYPMYVGFRKDKRRVDTWSMIVCWDEQIVKDMGPCSADLEFEGQVPKEWV